MIKPEPQPRSQKLRSFLSITLFIVLIILVGLLSFNLLQALIHKFA